MGSYRNRARWGKNYRKARLEALERKEMLAGDLRGMDVPGGALPGEVMGPLTAEQMIAAEAEAGEQAMRSGSRRGDGGSAALAIPSTEVEARSFDGSGNNLANPALGSTGEQLLRVAEAEYADGIAALAGEDRPSARAISNAVSAQDPEAEGNANGNSAFLYVWGQFIDHDIDLTEPDHLLGESADIEVPADDALFDPEGTGEEVIPFTRSAFDPATGDSEENPREQVNSITAWIDGSMVYGSDVATADSLRAFSGGRLLTSAGDLLPVDENGNFLAGDVRANENVQLTALHTLFVREHNLWADRIAESDSTLDDEAIYQRARAIVVAEIQSITVNEFLPALLGEGAIGEYAGYDASVDPSIANEFSTAAFRLGHSLLNDTVGFLGNDGLEVADAVPLAEAFFNPALLSEVGIDSVLKFAASVQAQEVDPQIVDGVRNFLFGAPGSGGLDLASLNIQRGRDHGLADYNATRVAYGLAPVEDFAGITSDPAVQATLEELYGSVDNIDLWVGALSEDHVEGSSVGELVQTIVADQFQRLRDGDRLWYENVFSQQEVAQIEASTLSEIIQRNTELTNLQLDVFSMESTIRGAVAAADAGVAVELVDGEGEVVETTETDVRGRFAFEDVGATGLYEVRVAEAADGRGTTLDAANVLISRGGQVVSGVDLGDVDAGGVDAGRGGAGGKDGGGHRRDGRRSGGRTRAIDTVMDGLAADDLLEMMMEDSEESGRRRGRRR